MSYADPEARYVVDIATIRMPYVAERRYTTVNTWPVVTPRSPLWLRRTAEQIGNQFRRETHLDFPPYSATSPDGQHVILLEAHYAIAYAKLIAGAIGIYHADTDPYLGWIWIHPYERAEGLVDQMWPEVLQRYPGIRGIGEDRDPNNTSAGNALLDHLLKRYPPT